MVEGYLKRRTISLKGGTKSGNREGRPKEEVDKRGNWMSNLQSKNMCQ